MRYRNGDLRDARSLLAMMQSRSVAARLAERWDRDGDARRDDQRAIAIGRRRSSGSDAVNVFVRSWRRRYANGTPTTRCTRAKIFPAASGRHAPRGDLAARGSARRLLQRAISQASTILPPDRSSARRARGAALSSPHYAPICATNRYAATSIRRLRKLAGRRIRRDRARPMAGVNRLQCALAIRCRFPSTVVVPAVGQGRSPSRRARARRARIFGSRARGNQRSCGASSASLRTRSAACATRRLQRTAWHSRRTSRTD